MSYRIATFLMLILLTFGNIATSDEFSALNKADINTYISELKDNNFSGLLNTYSIACEEHYESARDKDEFGSGFIFLPESKNNTTIYERAKSSNSYYNCINKVSNAFLAISPSFESTAKLKDLAQAKLEIAEQVQEESESQSSFMGLNWGIGFGYSYSDDNLIDSAQIVNGIVRVDSSKKQQPRLVLEFHKYFWCNDNYKYGNSGCGPFVAVAATPQDVLTGVGIGFMYGLKQSAKDSDGFSVGIGAILDADVKDLADGFKKNQAPPNGETTVRFEDKARWSYLLFVTRSF